MNNPGRFVVVALFLLLLFTAQLPAHPMGNFSINHYSKLEASQGAIRLEYILDFAEIPTFQMFPETRGSAPQSALQSRTQVLVHDWLDGLSLTIDGVPLPLVLHDSNLEILPGAGGLPTIRIRTTAQAAWSGQGGVLHFIDRNFSERIGWKEIVSLADSPLGFPEGNPFSLDRSNGLASYPADLLSNAPNVVEASVRIGAGVNNPIVAKTYPAPQTSARMPDRLSEILSSESVSARLIALGLLIAFALGSLHALSPGHGKTIVAAYLIGNRGTARHALFLGAVVTFTHTIGVFVLGFITLFLSRYIVPETLYPWISFLSGITIVVIGVSLLRQRLSGFAHDHGPHGHSHDVPAGGVTFRSLLGLGFSGGILPCPSALVVLLSATALHRIAIGLLLIVAFSLGLASVLVGIGVLVVRASRLLPRFDESHWAARLMPLISASVISVLGFGVAVQSIPGIGSIRGTFSFGGGALAVLGLGLFLGLKHATDADHVVAVTTFVSQERSLLRSCWIGAFWGIGHTLSLAVAGVAVIGLKLGISEWLAARLEFGVAIMLVGLGARVLIKAVREKTGFHQHVHVHDGDPSAASHSHWHIHLPGRSHSGWSHVGLRPLLVGAVHGAAGSAALMLLVLSTIRSPLQAFLYLGIFGLGTMLGMLAISFLLALPLHWLAERAGASYRAIQVLAGAFSCLFGLFLGAQILRALP